MTASNNKMNGLFIACGCSCAVAMAALAASLREKKQMISFKNSLKSDLDSGMDDKIDAFKKSFDSLVELSMLQHESSNISIIKKLKTQCEEMLTKFDDKIIDQKINQITGEKFTSMEKILESAINNVATLYASVDDHFEEIRSDIQKMLDDKNRA